MAGPIDIVVLNYNGARHLPACISSLQGQTYPALRILVADNGSRDGSTRVAKEHGVEVLEVGANLGFSRTNNRAAHLCDGELVFFVNNDMRFDRRCVEELVATFETHPGLFAADPKQMDWEGSKVVHGRTRISHGGLGSWFPLVSVDYTAPSRGTCLVPWGCAGSLMVDRRKFLALGGFDETFFLDCEDLDLCWRAWMRGWATVFVPEALVYHRVGATAASIEPGETPTGIPEWRSVGLEQNFLRFVIKTMAPPGLTLFVGCKLLQAGALAVGGQWRRATILAKALLGALELTASTWSERQRVRAWSIRSAEEILAAFLRDEAPR